MGKRDFPLFRLKSFTLISRYDELKLLTKELEADASQAASNAERVYQDSQQQLGSLTRLTKTDTKVFQVRLVFVINCSSSKRFLEMSLFYFMHSFLQQRIFWQGEREALAVSTRMLCCVLLTGPHAAHNVTLPPTQKWVCAVLLSRQLNP